MLATLKSLFSPPPFQAEAYQVYGCIVSQARQPFFYTECQVPDTLDGRFDAIALHLFLAIHRLRGEADAPLFLRALQEAFFADMDRSIREMGVSDTGVGKRVKAMAQAFYGRLKSYEETFADGKAFRQSLARNLYRASAPEAALVLLEAYVQRNAAHLKTQQTQTILAGDIRFIP